MSERSTDGQRDVLAMVQDRCQVSRMKRLEQQLAQYQAAKLAHYEGVIARQKRYSDRANPYNRETDAALYEEWLNGWNEQDELTRLLDAVGACAEFFELAAESQDTTFSPEVRCLFEIANRAVDQVVDLVE